MVILRSCRYSAQEVSIPVLRPLLHASAFAIPIVMVCHLRNATTPIYVDIIRATDASPGYFSLTLNNSIKMEATATRRAGLERFTFPFGSKPYFALDLANDLPSSFAGGELTIDPVKGRITIGGRWGSRFDTNVPRNLTPCSHFYLVLDPAFIPTKHLHVMIFLMAVDRR